MSGLFKNALKNPLKGASGASEPDNNAEALTAGATPGATPGAATGSATGTISGSPGSPHRGQQSQETPQTEDGGQLERFYTANATFDEPSFPHNFPEGFPPEIDRMSIEDSDTEKIMKLLKTDKPPMKVFDAYLGKDVMLQGKVYFSREYLLFYAHLPPATLDVLKATPLDKKGASLIPGKANYTRFWFVLRMGSLSWYANAGDKYFPVGMLPLHLMQTVTRLSDAPEKFIVKAFNGKSYMFRCDSRNGAHEWVKAIRKEMFRSKVRTEDFTAVVRIPLANIISANVKPLLDIASMMSLQVVASASDPENPERPLIGNYALVFFGEESPAREIQGIIEASTNNFASMQGVHQTVAKNQQLAVDFATSRFGPIAEDMLDTTPPAAFHLYEGTERDTDQEVLISPGLLDANQKDNRDSKSSNDGQRHRSNSMESSASVTSSSTSSNPEHGHKHRNVFRRIKDKLHVHKHNDSDDEASDDDHDMLSFVKVTSVPYKIFTSSRSESDDSDDEDADWDYESNDVGQSVDPKFSEDKLFPFTPANFTRKLTFNLENVLNHAVTHTSTRTSTSGAPSSLARIPTTNIEDEEELAAVNAWFQDFFGLEPFVTLEAEYLCTIEKPGDGSMWEGKLLVSNLFLCFQRCHTASSGLASVVGGGSNVVSHDAHSSGDRSQRETRMVIPLGDIIHFKESSPGSTDLRFEVSAAAYGVFRLRFHDASVREDAESVLRTAVQRVPVDDTGRILVRGRGIDFNYLSYDLRTSRIATYEPEFTRKLRMRMPPLFLDPTMASSGGEIMQGKPRQRLKFVMLMIGSRGDVQPYIALSQGLMKEGHRCCIVTHSEFKPFVEKYGIEHRTIAGDPRELMEIMISHGSISYSFIKDALHHFKGWLKELMHTAWEQISTAEGDVLIESPSSMIGIHIAEALNIAYFRAFTMPWTRTKMYPQALIQPDGNRSGTYNSLTYAMYERAVWFAISRYVNKWRKKHLNLPSTDLDNQRIEEIPFLYCVSPTVLVPPVDQPEWVHTCGYWELQPQKTDDVAEAAAKKELEEEKRLAKANKDHTKREKVKDKMKHGASKVSSTAREEFEQREQAHAQYEQERIAAARQEGKAEAREEGKSEGVSISSMSSDDDESDEDEEEEKQEEEKKKDDEIDPKLKEFIKSSHDSHKSVVYIGFGSIIVEDPEAMTNSVVEATRNAGVRCILARGWSARSTKDEKKKNKKKKNKGKKEKEKKDKITAEHVFEVEQVDHQWLFPRIEVCVHHGGSGTTGASLRAGKPTIIKPFFGDQFFYGKRVEDLGVGRNLKELTTDGLCDALQECCSNKEMIRQASVLGEQIRQENGVKDAVLSIYRELQYASDVTVRRRKRTEESAKNSLLTNPTNILAAPTHLLEGTHGILKRSLLHGWSKEDDEEDEIDEKGRQRTFSFPEFSHRENQARNCSQRGIVDVSL